CCVESAVYWCCAFFVFFFFQAEDGIRDFHVTGVQTCALPISVVDGRMVFEVLVPEGAEVMARYRADFYAEAPAVTRHRVRAADGGEGHVWYVGTQLDQPGVTHVVRRALARHGLLGPYAEIEGLELATRVTPSGAVVDFLLHHGPAEVTVPLHAAGEDVLTGRRYAVGDRVTLRPTDVVVLRRDEPTEVAVPG